jgi:type 1 glutamine amidotransferase
MRGSRDMTRLKRIFFLATIAAFVCVPALAQDSKVEVLFLSKSVSFEHPCIKWVDGKSHVDGVLNSIAPAFNANITSIKDASLINAENLKKYKLVIFFTQGELSETGKDGFPPMGKNGVADLLAWIENGGGFMGFHCASDTFHTPENGPVTPYLEMVGGEFAGHGKQFEGTVKVVDSEHPIITASKFPVEFKITDEWYVFRNLNQAKIHVLALLDPGEQRTLQAPMYNVPDYPIAWVSERGKGRVFFDGMGHREDVWSNQTFQALVLAAAKWALGEGPVAAAPNYAAVVPSSAPKNGAK